MKKIQYRFRPRVAENDISPTALYPPQSGKGLLGSPPYTLTTETLEFKDGCYPTLPGISLEDF